MSGSSEGLKVALWNHISRSCQRGEPTQTVTSPSGWTVQLPLTPPAPGSVLSSRVTFSGAKVRGVHHGTAVLHTYPDFTGFYPNGRLGILNIQAFNPLLISQNQAGRSVRRAILRELQQVLNAAFPQYNRAQP